MDALSEAGRQRKAAAAVVAAAAGGGNWASKGSLEKLVGEVNRLSERTKDGEDSVAFLDHDLKGIRDEVRGAVRCVRCGAKLFG